MRFDPFAHWHVPGSCRGAAGVRLSDLQAVAAAAGAPAERRGDAYVVDLSEDSRSVRPGWMFAAVRGAHCDGHDRAADAVAAGAAALMVERFLDLPVPQLRVGSTRAALGAVAAAAHGDPSHHLALVGITGTNGKTTLAYLAVAGCEGAGIRTGMIGTVETRMAGQAVPSMLTTPAAPDLQRTLARMRTRGADAVVMEVSSHALDQSRVAGCRFAVSVFTTLEPEHLDYHGTMGHYYASKAKLFDPGATAAAVICVDGWWGRRLAHQVAVPLLTYGRDGTGADVRYRSRSCGPDGIEVAVQGRTGSRTIRSAVVGTHNAANVVGAYLAALQLGADAEEAARGIAGCPRPPGRFELVNAGQDFLIVADYAHTPGSLGLLIAAARQLTGPGGQVRLVVGARGGRDRYKRQDLARAAAGADRAVITTDNPGGEDPSSIIAQLRAGLVGFDADHVAIEPDRVRAIRWAVQGAGPGDVVVVAGRGHETTIRMADRVVILDDRQVAADAVRRYARPAAAPAPLGGAPAPLGGAPAPGARVGSPGVRERHSCVDL
ncbi:MAG TPA: UDP-N-acetylmuramoyl-L-alanyl-D-glutamate--2,6-diaminopimelate ligase [Acidimicrobiales bacterium]|nr:UDP-N-acetylmuramoyl-L-alanyl-D-glutamate--2,6-diaminopimelate ligase [Acidimicrobiales bacterium]